MFEKINNLMDMLGMDANSFYPMILAFISLLINLIKERNIRRKNLLLELFCKKEGGSVYGFIVLVEMFGIFIELLFAQICIGIVKFLLAIVGVELNGKMQNRMIFVVTFIVGVFIVKLLKRNRFLRARILGDRMASWLLYAPMILMRVIVLECIWQVELGVLKDVVNILFVLLEVVGLVYFQGRYTEYPFSSIRLYTNMGEIIECNDIKKIKRRRDILCISEEKQYIRIKYENITKVEYYGESTVVLVKEWSGFKLMRKGAEIVHDGISKLQVVLKGCGREFVKCLYDLIQV